MLNRPSSRKKSHGGGLELNLVPILDTMVTLIGFLLFTTTLLPLVSQESLLPLLGKESLSSEKDPPLQLTLDFHSSKIKIWSPTQKILAQTLSSLPQLTQSLQQIKKNFPLESQVIILPHSETSYESLIELLDVIQPFFPQMVFGNLQQR